MTLGAGDIPGWITALVAIGGVLYGGYNLRRLTLDRRRIQADRIYFGLEFDRSGPPSTTVHVMNLSDAPITLVQVFFAEYPGFLGESGLPWSEGWSKSALMVGDQWNFELEFPADLDLIVGYTSFTDATNRTWYKLSNGKLYSHGSHPGIFDRWRFFLPTWVVRLRTVGMSPEAENQWLRRYGFLGGLFRWGFGKF